MLDNTTYSGKRTKLIPMVAAGTSQQSIALVEQMLDNPSIESQWITTLVDYAQTWRYDGYDIDFEHLDSSYRTELTTFISDLAAQLHPLGKMVSIATDAFAGDDSWSEWDINALLDAADQIHVMGYSLPLRAPATSCRRR